MTTNASDVTYTASFPDSVARSVQERLSDWVSVRDFGANGNDSSDDTEAIQNALDSQAVGGGTVRIPRGTYFYSTLNVPSGVSLVGEGSFSTLLVCTATTGDAISIASASTISGLRLTYSGVPSGACNVRIHGNRVTITECEFTNYYIGVIAGTQNSQAIFPVIANCSFRSPVAATGAGGIFLQNYGNALVRDCVMSGDSHPSVQPDFGIRLHNGDTAFLTDINITLHGHALLMDVPAGLNNYATRMSGCLFDSAGSITTTSAVSSARIAPAGGVYDMLASNCWFGLSRGGSGLTVDAIGTGAVDGFELSNCQFVNNANAGAEFLSPAIANFKITGGYASANGVYGLRVGPGVGRFSVNGFTAANVAGRGANARGINIDSGHPMATSLPTAARRATPSSIFTTGGQVPILCLTT